ncbi:MAG: Ig-like domain-containing protein [Myxococcaceae bacterium]
MKLVFQVFAVIWLSLTLWPTQSDACSCLGGVIAVSPSEGATNVPTNSEIKLLVTFGVPREIALESDDGLVPSTVEVHDDSPVLYLRVRPDQALKAGATYRLVLEGRPVSSFTTGSGRDETRPHSEGLRSVEFTDGSRSIFGGTSSCGESVGYSVEISPGVDDQASTEDVWFHVYAAPTADALDFSRPTTAVRGGLGFLGRGACHENLRLGEDRSTVLVLAAVDLAGNESDRTGPEQLSPGAFGGGCSSAIGGSSVGALLLLSGLLRLRRRS